MLSKADLPADFEMVDRDGAAWIEFRLDCHRVIFSLRSSSGVPFPMDVGRTTEPPSDRQIAVRTRLCRAAGIEPDSVWCVRQVHRDRILEMDAIRSRETGRFLDRRPSREEADGIFLSTHPGEGVPPVPAVVTADCLPVALCGPAGTALLHLGWRGLSTRMIENAVSMTGATEAVIGPAIGPCCYEVGAEVFEALGIEDRESRGRVDLVAVASTRLIDSSVDVVRTTGLCTGCEKDLLFSHRRDGQSAGRQVAMLVPI